MDRSIIFTTDAEEEIAEAYFWYEEKEAGLGDRFLLTLKKSLQLEAPRPDLYPVRFDQIHRTTIPKFPYAIYFGYDEKSIYV